MMFKKNQYYIDTRDNTVLLFDEQIGNVFFFLNVDTDVLVLLYHTELDTLKEY